MSSRFQGLIVNGAIPCGNGPIVSHFRGLPLNAAGAVVVEAGPITFYDQGFPFNANGALVGAQGDPIFYGAGATPHHGNGALAGQPGVGAFYHQGVPYLAGGGYATNGGVIPPAPPFEYAWIIGSSGTDAGYVRGITGDLDPTVWPPGNVSRTVGILSANTSQSLYIRQFEQGQAQVAGCYSVWAEVEGVPPGSKGFGPDANMYCMAWQATDYYGNPLLNLCNYIRSIVGTTIGVNLTSYNNFITVGTNGTLWGWNNGLGFGSLGDPGSQGGNSFAWPFGGVVVNYYVNAADLLTIQFNQSIGAPTSLYTTIPTMNGDQQITVPGNGTIFTVTVPGLKNMFAQAVADGVKVSFSLSNVA